MYIYIYINTFPKIVWLDLIGGYYIDTFWSRAQVSDLGWFHFLYPNLRDVGQSFCCCHLRYSRCFIFQLVGGIPAPLKNISQLGWLFPRYGNIKSVPNHQPVLRMSWWCFLSETSYMCVYFLEVHYPSLFSLGEYRCTSYPTALSSWKIQEN